MGYSNKTSWIVFHVSPVHSPPHVLSKHTDGQQGKVIYGLRKTVNIAVICCIFTSCVYLVNFKWLQCVIALLLLSYCWYIIQTLWFYFEFEKETTLKFIHFL